MQEGESQAWIDYQEKFAKTLAVAAKKLINCLYGSAFLVWKIIL